MEKDKRLWLPFVAVLTFLLFLMTGFSRAHAATDSELRDDGGSGAVGPAGLNEISVMPATSAQSYYVVDDNLYVLMQKPMAKAYGSFSMLPVIVPDTPDHSDLDAGSVAQVSGETLNADANSAPDFAHGGQENLQAIDVAINLKFKGEAKSEESAGVNGSRDDEDIADPFEPINRFVFNVNDKVYFWALKPIATAYGAVVPEWGRMRVRNFVDNLQSPIRLVNSLLQFKMHKFGVELAKLVLNSTVGLGGLFDIASRHPELKVSKEDLGQTFGFWGAGEGFYLVLPFLGPSSLRDAVGTVGDNFLDPIGHITPLRDAIAVRSYDVINDTSFKIGDYEDIKAAALDPYVSIRDIYKQYRRNKIRE